MEEINLMTTYQKHQEIRRYCLVKEECRRRGLTLHHTNAGWLVRKNGRIVSQAFSLSKLQENLKTQP